MKDPVSPAIMLNAKGRGWMWNRIRRLRGRLAKDFNTAVYTLLMSPGESPFGWIKCRVVVHVARKATV